MSPPTVLFWFRQDLRVTDNPALIRAAQAGRVVPIYILDDENAGEYRIGGAGRWWLHHSLASLNQSLGGNLRLYRGAADRLLPQIVEVYGADSVFWNRCYEPWRIARDTAIKSKLTAAGTHIESDNGSLLWEPWEVLKQDGTPYRVFTPFFRKGCLNAAPPRQPLAQPETLDLVESDDAKAVPMESLELLPRVRWDRMLEPHWEIGEAGAQNTLDRFLDAGLGNYKRGRDFPALKSVSCLSPHLHWGEISPNQVWHAASAMPPSDNLDHFRSELGWREFSYSLLYHFPDLPTQNLQPAFDRFPWHSDADLQQRWQRGQTGIPIVDAGMRELWQTGYMHNRVRMIVASFLVKNLLQHWHAGEAWFRDCLVDADLASNSASWQWVAGCGADAAPYFRIFNPVTQGLKFDPNGVYTRRWVPELADVPNECLFNPWDARPGVLEAAGVFLGKTYPKPIVDLKISRQRALDAYQTMKQST